MGELQDTKDLQVLFPAGAQEEYGNHNNKGPVFGEKVYELFKEKCAAKGYTAKTFEYLFTAFSGTPFWVHEKNVDLLLSKNNNKYENLISTKLREKIEENFDEIKNAEDNEVENPYLEKFSFSNKFENWDNLDFTEKLRLFTLIPKIEKDGKKNLISLKQDELGLNEDTSRNFELDSINKLGEFTNKLKGVEITNNSKTVEITNENISKFDLLEGDIAQPLKNLLDGLNRKITIIITGMGGQENEKVPLLKSLVLHNNVEKVIVTNRKYVDELVDENTIALTNGWSNVIELAEKILHKEKIFSDYNDGKNYINSMK